MRSLKISILALALVIGGCSTMSTLGNTMMGIRTPQWPEEGDAYVEDSLAMFEMYDVYFRTPGADRVLEHGVPSEAMQSVYRKGMLVAFFSRPTKKESRLIALSVAWTATTPGLPALDAAVDAKRRGRDLLVASANPKIRSFDVVPDSTLAPRCVRYTMVIEESRSLYGHTQEQNDGYLCLDPVDSSRVVEVFEKRHAPWGKMPPSDGSELQRFLRTVRFSPPPGLQVARIDVPGDPTWVATGADAVWVTTGENDQVVRIDPAQNRIAATISVPKPEGIAVGEGSVWVASNDDKRVVRIDPKTNAIIARITVGRSPLGVSTGLGAVWVTNHADNTVSRIDPSTSEVVATIRVPKGPEGITVGDGSVWVACTEANEVVELSASTNAVTGQAIRVSRLPEMVTVAAGAVWVSSSADGVLSKIDPAQHAVSAKRRVSRQAFSISYANDMLYVATGRLGGIQLVNPQSMSLVGKPIPVGVNSFVTAVGYGALWVPTGIEQSVTRVDLASTQPVVSLHQ